MCFRILNVFSFRKIVRTLYGLASVMPASLGNPLKMGSVDMLAWIVLPLVVANWRLKP